MKAVFDEIAKREHDWDIKKQQVLYTYTQLGFELSMLHLVK